MMSRSTLFMAVGLSLCLATLAMMVFLLSSQSGRKDSGHAYPAAAELERRLERLEARLALREAAGAASPLKVPAPSPAPGSVVDNREPLEDGEDGEEAEASVDLEALLARMDDLSRRVRGLEEDPIQRGFSFLESSSAELRRQGVLSLERLATSDPEARAAIREMLSDPDERVRVTTLDTLADIGDRESVAEMMPLLGDPSAAVRREVVASLTRLEARDAAIHVADLVGDENKDVREVAVDSLGKLKYREGAALLLEALGDESSDVRGEAIASLGEIGATAAVPRLRQIYETDPGRHRYRLVSSLRMLGDEQPYQNELAQLSRTAISSQDDGDRIRAIHTLAWLDREKSRPILQQIVESSSGRVRQEAERALRGERDWRRRR